MHDVNVSLSSNVRHGLIMVEFTDLITSALDMWTCERVMIESLDCKSEQEFGGGAWFRPEAARVVYVDEHGLG